jgi:hypothetical protein
MPRLAGRFVIFPTGQPEAARKPGGSARPERLRASLAEPLATPSASTSQRLTASRPEAVRSGVRKLSGRLRSV